MNARKEIKGGRATECMEIKEKEGKKEKTENRKERGKRWNKTEGKRERNAMHIKSRTSPVLSSLNVFVCLSLVVSYAGWGCYVFAPS